MEFVRNVEFNGKVYARHAVSEMRPHGGVLAVVMNHYVFPYDGEPDYQADTVHMLSYTSESKFSDILSDLMALPEYTEYVDPNVALVDEMAALLDDDQAASVPNAYREWEPGVGYSVGDRRRYGTGLYRCLVDHTSQEDQTPDIVPSLWAVIIASEDPDAPLPWVQPDSTNPYMAGDRVTHNGHVWESDVDNNVWEPGVYGWTQIE